MKRLYLVLISLLIVSSCTSSELGAGDDRRAPSLQPDGQVKEEGRKQIALLVPLSGPTAKVGKSIMDAAKLAVEESPDTGFVVAPYDTSNTVEGAKAAAEAALADGAKIIIGPLYGSQTKEIAPLAAQKNVKIISFSNDKSVAGGGVFIFGLIPDQQVGQVVRYANSRGIKGYTAIVPSDVFGAEVKNSLERNAGGKVRKVEVYQSRNVDFKFVAGEIAKVYENSKVDSSSGTEAILIPEGGDKLEDAVTALREKGIDTKNVRILGTYLWDNENLYDVEGIHGAWYPSAPRNKMQEFRKKFYSAYSYYPETIAALGYDGASLGIRLANSNFSSGALLSGSGFDGATGHYRFTGNGTNERNYEIQEVSEGYVVPAAKK